MLWLYLPSKSFQTTVFRVKDFRNSRYSSRKIESCFDVMANGKTWMLIVLKADYFYRRRRTVRLGSDWRTETIIFSVFCSSLITQERRNTDTFISFKHFLSLAVREKKKRRNKCCMWNQTSWRLLQWLYYTEHEKKGWAVETVNEFTENNIWLQMCTNYFPSQTKFIRIFSSYKTQT